MELQLTKFCLRSRSTRVSWFLLLATLPLLGLFACQAPGSGDDSTSDTEWIASQTAEATARLEASDAGRIVLRAINAAGGLEAWYAAATSSYGWEYANIGADLQFKTVMVADNRTRRVYHDIVSLGAFEAPDPFEGRMAWDGNNAWIYPGDTERVNPRFWASTGYYFSSIPFVLADPGIMYEAMPAEELDGMLYDMVKVGYKADVGDASDNYTLYVDQQTDRLFAIRYTVTFGGRPARGETLFYYQDYVTVDGLTVPTFFDGYNFIDGQKSDFKNKAWVTDISFSKPFDEAAVIMPEGAKIVGMPDGE